jgi:peptidoglycan hydrolase CwlO-like protein
MVGLEEKSMTRNLNILNLILTIILSTIIIFQFILKGSDDKLLAMDKRVDSVERQQRNIDDKLTAMQSRIDDIYNILAGGKK